MRRLYLHKQHEANGARFGLFGEWEVPLYYRSILEEHHAVRQIAGVFDISHMGEFRLTGPSVCDFLEKLLPRSTRSMAAGQARYMPLLNVAGGMVDDIIVYRASENDFLIIVNAGNVQKDFDWIQSHVPSGVKFENWTDRMGLLAVQGPLAERFVENALNVDLGKVRNYHFITFGSGMIARTGYTGEDGFEIMAGFSDIPEIWNRLFSVKVDYAGKPTALVPVGFGARDTLRLEAGMLLYGHDMNDETTPLEAGISWAIELNKPDFIGKQALVDQSRSGLQKKLIGFEMMERGIPRAGCAILKGQKNIGEVTSGSFSPTLQKNIGLGYVSAGESASGNEMGIQIRDKSVGAKVVSVPFYKRSK